MINFNFGKKKTDKKQLIILGLILSSIIAVLSQCTGVSENGLWDLLDEIQRKYFPQTILNELILQDPNQVKRRVERDVTKTIDDIRLEYDRIISDYDKKYEQKYIEKPSDGSEAQKLLGGEMRICAPWVDNCE